MGLWCWILEDVGLRRELLRHTLLSPVFLGDGIPFFFKLVTS